MVPFYKAGKKGREGVKKTTQENTSMLLTLGGAYLWEVIDHHCLANLSVSCRSLITSNDVELSRGKADSGSGLYRSWPSSDLG